MKIAAFSKTGLGKYTSPVKREGKMKNVQRTKTFANQLDANPEIHQTTTTEKVGPLSSPEKKDLKAPSSSPQTSSPLRKGLEKALQDEVEVQKKLQKVMKRGVGSMEELLNIQMSVYRYTQHVELLSKTVDRATQGLKQTLQTRL